MLALNEKDKPIMANYKINSPLWSNLEPQMLYDIDRPTTVVIDESYSWLESRMSGAEVNRYLSYILFQERKRGIDFILTAQLSSTIDLRFKGLADLYIVAEKVNGGFKYNVIRKDGQGRKTFMLSEFAASKYYPAYDTMQKVDPIDQGMIYNVTPDKRVIIPELDRILDDMVEESPKWTMPMIKDFCLENGLKINVWADKLYARLKRRQNQQALREAENDG
jgi:hypothetical protein